MKSLRSLFIIVWAPRKIFIYCCSQPVTGCTIFMVHIKLAASDRRRAQQDSTRKNAFVGDAISLLCLYLSFLFDVLQLGSSG